MSKDSLTKPTTASGEWAHDTEVTLPDGIHLKVDWNKSELTIKLNGRVIDISSKSKRVVVGREPETSEI